MSVDRREKKLVGKKNCGLKRNKSDSENEFSLESLSDLENSAKKVASPLKRNNHLEISCEESPKKRFKAPNFEHHHPRRLNMDKGSVSLCTEQDRKKFFSTPKSERKTSSTGSRLKQLNTEAIQRNLSSNWADIIEELEEQTKALSEYTEKVAKKYNLDKDTLTQQIETDAEVLRKRQKQINFGKVTSEYQRYVESVPRQKREHHYPKTPNKFRKCSRRKFDGLVKKWRKLLHVWDENPEALKDFKYSNDPEDEKDDFGGCSGISYNIDDYDIIDYNEDDCVYVEDSELKSMLSRHLCQALKVAQARSLVTRSALPSLQTRNASTTTTSKGQAISISNLNLEPNQRPKPDLSFEDSETAFKSKSSLELLRGYLVFQLCSLNFLIDNQKFLLSFSRRLLGKRLFSHLMRMTFYGHFVAGEDPNDIRQNVEKMMKYGVKAILDYSAEEDLTSDNSGKNIQGSGESDLSKKYFHPSELNSDKNKKIFMDCIEAVSDVTNQTGIAAIKITSLVRPQLLLKLSTLVSQMKQLENNYSLLIWDNLMQMSDEQFDQLMNQTGGLESVNEKQNFSSSELGELRNMFTRIDDLVKHAVDKNVRVFVDAEQTYFQDAIHRITIEIMRKYNRSRCVVLNTYQNYLKSAYDTLRQDMDLANKENCYFGAKLVRGAYMEQERERAKQMGYEDPINESYEATTKMYEKSLMHCLEEVKKNSLSRISVMVASHNEQTVKFAVEKMIENDINPSDRVICFGQLLGMCDYISFYLGGMGFSVYKYVPYGPVEEVLPYLSRRATENKGIFEKLQKEKRLIMTELKRRMLNF
ncbi:proline dehydrogenase mitochondrial isoform X3 [Brachionus plicatilis]|uniref:Proline dehydrogenase 1, mitochondrial n=1 Tax=Brachionus plicatilis TaxID=10195 RepID=A0A3M7T5V3_BRAPC|nr:proline dehydrogenase mitochondrial isoform X3 [Brachionus plicatilis]